MGSKSLRSIALMTRDLMDLVDGSEGLEWHDEIGGDFRDLLHYFLADKFHLIEKRKSPGWKINRPYKYLLKKLLTDDDESSNGASTATSSSKSSPAPNIGMISIKIVLY